MRLPPVLALLLAAACSGPAVNVAEPCDASCGDQVALCYALGPGSAPVGFEDCAPQGGGEATSAAATWCCTPKGDGG